MRFQCPMCKGIVSVENADMGSSVQCGHCNKPVTVPSSQMVEIMKAYSRENLKVIADCFGLCDR